MNKFNLHTSPKKKYPWWALWLQGTNHRVDEDFDLKDHEMPTMEDIIDSIRSKDLDLPCHIRHHTWHEGRLAGSPRKIYTMLVL